ncbi:MAG: hypothetical protein WA865_05100 [Spirulinaceae cyanobacterium]
MIANLIKGKKLSICASLLVPALLLSGYTPLKNQDINSPGNNLQIAQSSIWRSVTSIPGGFVVLMPGEPVRRWQSVPTSVGEANFLGYLVNRSQEETRYYMAYSYFPYALEEAGASEIFDEIFEEIRPTVAGAETPTAPTKESIESDDFVAAQYILKLEDDYTAIYRFYLIDRRIYQQAVFTRKAQHLPKSIEGFFDSFKTID